MKLFILSILALILSSETFAQHRRGGHGPGNGHGYGRGNGPIVIGPRYNPNGNRRVRTARRAPVSWGRGFNYSCGRFGELIVNGSPVHSFRYAEECVQALNDIRRYGDFCDNEDMYSRFGALEAQFNFAYQCRAALGWYY